MKRVILFGMIFSGIVLSVRSQQVCPDSEIEKVYLVFKTHLDIGFTDLGSNVLNTYVHEFIPSVLTLTEDINARNDSNQYKWTTGSWLLWNYMERSSKADRKRMEDAIWRKDFFWHANPFTLEAELCDSALYEAAFFTSKELDKRFSRNTISMKQTDVPGITRAAIPFMQHNGIKLIHIGTNPCVPQPDVPGVFRWRHSDGSEICVVYSIGYGENLIIPGTKIAGVLCFTGDNHGAHSPEEIQQLYDKIRARYPHAEIEASSLDAIAGIIDEHKAQLPVVTSEIGDSWIWGVASDPKKIAELRQLMRLRTDWLRAGTLLAGSGVDMRFAMPLLLVTEHTWGLDVKWNLNDWDGYQPATFSILSDSEKYRRMEKSWNEKQAFIYEAIAQLPARLQREAIDSIAALTPVKPSTDGFKKFTITHKPIKAGRFEVVFDALTGGINYLKDNQTSVTVADGMLPFGEVGYQTFSEGVFTKFIGEYCPPNPPEWALLDYGKHGLEQSAGIMHETYLYEVEASYIRSQKYSTTVLLFLTGGSTDQSSPLYGAPRKIVLEYIFPAEGDICVTLSWFEKQKTRIPEAMWFSFCPVLTDPALYIDKLGSEVDVTDVVANGSRHQHAVGNYLRFAGQDYELRIESLDAPLVVLNKRDLMYFNNDPVEPAQGIHYCLYNNCWGTNYPQWFDGDMRFRFRINIR